MYIAMNRFRVAAGREAEFVEVWRKRDSYLDKVPDAVPRPEPRSATGNKPYTALGKRYYPMKSADGYRAKGHASWYGRTTRLSSRTLRTFPQKGEISHW